MTNETTSFSYDEIPYPSHSFSQTHPGHLATLATLLGMNPPPVTECRVLELGCASGGNIIPMALGLPHSEFVGVDLSVRQIEAGQARIATLGLENVRLEQRDIMEIEPDFGRFDYIIAHGVYSWIPAPVRDKLLAVCQQNLAPNGVAYISYNTYPGWRMLGTVRDMMLFHTRETSDPNERVQKARDLIEFLAEAKPADDAPHASFLNAYLSFVHEYIIPKHDEYLLHDELEEVNEPVYFYQFAELAARHGLQYLAEADFQGMLASNLPPEIAKTLRQMAKSTVELEQYMDFLRNRAFRQTLLCHQGVRLGAKMTADRLAGFYISSSALPENTELDINSVSVEKFKASTGAVLSIDHPVSKAAMVYLAEIWPKSVSFPNLLEAARARLNGSQSSEVVKDAQVLGANLLRAYSYSESLIELRVHSPRFVLDITEQPVASPVARLQALEHETVTNMRHERVELDDVTHQILLHLDGSHDRAALLDILTNLAADGIITVKVDDQPVEDTNRVREVLTKRLEAHLQQLAKTALLVD